MEPETKIQKLNQSNFNDQQKYQSEGQQIKSDCSSQDQNINKKQKQKQEQTNQMIQKLQIKTKIQQSKKQIRNEQLDEWKQNQSQSDEKQIDLTKKHQFQNEGQQNYFNVENQHQITAIFDEEQLNSIMNKDNQKNQLNKAFIEYDNNEKSQKVPLTVYDHNVENKFLLLLYLLYRKEIYALMPKDKQSRIDLHPANKNKIKIFSSNPEQLKEITRKISQIIRKISIIKLNIKPEEANKMKNSKKLAQKLFEKKRIIFAYRNMNQKCYYFGGQSSQTQLSAQFKQIRNYKFRNFKIFDYLNTRSYKIILSRIISNKLTLKSLSHLNAVCLQLIQYIHNSTQRYQNKQKERNLCFLMTVTGYCDNLSPKQMEHYLTNFISQNFYCITFVIKRGKSSQFPKLKVEGVDFVYLNERRFTKSYIYIICPKEIFFEKRQVIIEELEKLNERNMIYGVRYFNNISPQIKDYKKPQNYKKIPFPEQKPYSFIITPKVFKSQLEELIQKTQKFDQNEIVVNQSDKNEKKFYDFDWKGHLRGLSSNLIVLN